MHIKRAYYSGSEDGEPLVRVVDPAQSAKTASGIRPAIQEFLSTLRPSAEYTYVLVNAMGNSWYYGSNSNADWYGYNPHLEFDGLLHAWDGIGRDVETDRMRGKTWAYGYPCFYNAAAYAHHKNTDPQLLGFGDVVFVSHNPEMHRIELVIRVFNAEAEKKGHSNILDRIRAGERCDVSMGTKVPFDLAECCTDWDAVKAAWKTYDPRLHAHPGIAILQYHKRVAPIRGLAVTPAEYCACFRASRNKVQPDGRRFFVYNDFPRFFDISFVWIGADRTARVMWHLGSTERSQPSAESRARHTLSELLSLVSGKTAMDKEVPGGIARAVQHDADTAPELPDLEALTQAFGTKGLLSTLAGLGIMPKPQEFQVIVLTSVPGGSLIRRVLDSRGGVFDTSASAVDDTWAVDPKCFDSKLAAGLQNKLSSRSVFAPYLNPRLLSPRDKTAGRSRHVVATELMNKMAAQYNGYRLSVLEQAPELFEKAADYLDPWVQTQKEAGVGLAGLLLGLGPVISLLSSHLRDQNRSEAHLGPMASFIADNPTFTTLVTVGACLRAAMAISAAGGLSQATKTVFSAVARSL